MANDALMPKFLYTMLKQLDLRSIDWNEVAGELGITNGHAARMRYSRFKLQMEGKPTTPRKAKTPKEKATRKKKPNSKMDSEVENDKRKMKSEDGSALTSFSEPQNQRSDTPAVSEADGLQDQVMMSGGSGTEVEVDGSDIVVKNEPRDDDSLHIAAASSFLVSAQNESQDTDASYELDTSSNIMDLHSPHLHLDSSQSHRHSQAQSPLSQHPFVNPIQENMMSFSSMPGNGIYVSPNMSSATSFHGHSHGHDLMADMQGVQRPDFGSYMNAYDTGMGSVGGFGGAMMNISTNSGMMNSHQQRGMVKSEDRWDDGYRLT